MNFKDQLKKDLDIFINPTEFADIHVLDGKQVSVVVDSESFNEFSGTVEMENAMQGIYQSAITIHVKTADYEKPEVGYRLELDGQYYYVTGVSESFGLLSINLMSHEN